MKQAYYYKTVEYKENSDSDLEDEETETTTTEELEKPKIIVKKN